MSYRKLQVNCNRCFKSFYGEEDLSCHIIMAHQTADIIAEGANPERHHFASRGYITKAKDEAQEYIPSRILSLLCKVEKYFDGIATDVMQMKEDIFQLKGNIPPAYLYTNKKIPECKTEHFEGLTQNGLETNSTCMEVFTKVLAEQKELREYITKLDKKIENQQPCQIKGQEMIMKAPVTVQAPKKKISKVAGHGDRVQKVLLQLEKEKERSRQLLGTNSQLKAQTKLLRSKIRQNSASSAERLNQKIDELMIKCDKLSQENNSLRKSTKHQDELADQYFGIKISLDKENEGLKNALASSNSDLRETKTRLESSENQNNAAQDHIELQERKINNLDNLINQMAKEKEDTQHKIRKLLDEVELCRGVVMRKDILEGDLKKEQERCKQLQEKINVLSTDLVRKDTEAQTLQNTLKEVKRAKDVLETVLRKASNEQVRLSVECSGLQSEVEKRKKQEETLQWSIREAKESMSKIDGDNIALQQTIEEMKLQNSELKDSLTVVEEAKNSLEQENTALKQNIADGRTRCNNSEQKLAELATEKLRIEQELISERKELQETERELQEKVAALFDLDAERGKLDDDNEQLQELNAELEEEISGYKELLADYDDLMKKHRQRISEIEMYKVEVEQLKQSEKENLEHLSVMVREGNRLGEEIARLQQEKEELHSKVDTCRCEKIDESHEITDECKDKGQFESQLKHVLQELQCLAGKKEDSNDDLNADQVISEIRLELASKNSHIREMDIAIVKLKGNVDQLTCNVKSAKMQEEEERYAKEQSEMKIKQMQVELDELRLSRSPNDSGKDRQDEIKGKEKTEAGNQVQLHRTTLSFEAKVEDAYFEDVDDFEIHEPAVTLNVSDDELFGRKPQKISPEEMGADFDDSEYSTCENKTQFQGYLPSRVTSVKKEFPTPTQLAPLTSSVSTWPAVGKKSFLGPLPPLATTAKVPKPLKAPKKKTKKKEHKERSTKAARGGKSKKLISKLYEDDVENNNAEFNNDDIANLLDNL